MTQPLAEKIRELPKYELCFGAEADGTPFIEEWDENLSEGEPACLLSDVSQLAAQAEAEWAAKVEWQPMSSAPKDGTEVLLLVERRAGCPGKMLVGHYMPGGHCIEDHPPIDEGWYFWTGGMFDQASKPLLWMKLPEAAHQRTAP